MQHPAGRYEFTLKPEVGTYNIPEDLGLTSEEWDALTEVEQEDYLSELGGSFLGGLGNLRVAYELLG